MKNVLIFIGILVLFIGYVLVKNFYQFYNKEKEMEKFKPYITEYLNTEIKDSLTTTPYIVGKVLSIDTTDKILDYFTFTKFSDEIRAKSPDEIKTIVFIQWYWVKEGEYINEETKMKDGEAFRSGANISIVDWTTKTTICKKNFIGQAPLKYTTLEGDFKSARPMFKVIDFIEQLPRK